MTTLAQTPPPAEFEGYAMGAGGLVFVAIYLSSLLLIGWLGHRAKKNDSLDDHYLGGRALGFGVLFLTLYATQYSGNSFIGFVGNAYRGGFVTIASVLAMMAVVGGYFIYAPKLYRRSHRRRYITLGDYVHDRFQSRALTVLLVVLGIFALGNYVLTNLLALGKVSVVVSGGRVSFEFAVIVLALIMVAYETLGGMRSVAWTDVTQGIILLLSLALLAFGLFVHIGGPAGVAGAMAEARPTVWDPPAAKQKLTWLSTALLFLFGISLYPHGVQRVYAARDERTLRRSLMVMVFMPMVTTLVLVLMGVMAIGIFPGMEGKTSDRTTMLMVGRLVEELPALALLGPVLVAAVLAATMSTIDSALLAISSMVSNDLYRPLRPASSQAVLTRVGKATSLALMAAVVWVTILLKDQTIWRLMEIKLEVLAQVAPAVMLGVHWRALRWPAVLAGALTGTGVAVALTLGGFGGGKPLGFHPGIWGLAANVAALLIVQAATPNSGRTGIPQESR